MHWNRNQRYILLESESESVKVRTGKISVITETVIPLLSVLVIGNWLESNIGNRLSAIFY